MSTSKSKPHPRPKKSGVRDFDGEIIGYMVVGSGPPCDDIYEALPLPGQILEFDPIIKVLTYGEVMAFLEDGHLVPIQPSVWYKLKEVLCKDDRRADIAVQVIKESKYSWILRLTKARMQR